jgi:glycosyltransferase involved in cell wall biosynthesis
VGKNPPKEVCKLQVTNRKLQSSHQPSAISHQPIVITGYVEDPTPYFADSAVFIVPLRAGGGMRVKILNALAMGIPVVSTTVGCEGINVTHGENIVIADTPEDFAAGVVGLINKPDDSARLAVHGRRLVENRYDYRITYRALDDVYHAVVAGGSQECG